jgi:AraC-like DNA-binding protein
MKIEYFKPKNIVLQKYIEGYYFLTNTQQENDTDYLTFPNNYCIVSVTNNCTFEFEKEKVIVSEDDAKNCLSTVITNYRKPIHLSYKGVVKELTIYFKPLGINAFLDKNLINYLNDFFQIFAPFEDYLPTMQTILATTDTEKARTILENYWLSKLKTYQSSFLQKAINLLEDYENDYTIQEVAEACETSRQNLVKIFKIHLGKTPSDYKKINRFRNALNQFQKQKDNQHLTKLLNNSTFYDQSHFIKDFRSLTGMLPKTFFKNLDCNKGEDIKWLWI